MTEIDIINRALIKLGEPPIASLEQSPFGKTYQIIFNDVKNLLLSAYPWRFAVTLQKLVRTDEPYGDRYKYRLPLDCLLLVHVFGTDCYDLTDARPYTLQGYEVADNAVITYLKDGISVEYVRQIEDLNLMSPLFLEAMTVKIAAEQSMRLKHSVQLKQMLENEFFYLIRQAELNNEIIKDKELIPDNSWVLVRNTLGSQW